MMRRGQRSEAKKQYDDRFPVIAFRVPRMDYNHFKDELEKLDVPMSEFLRKALEGYKADIDKPRAEGVHEGYQRAKARYAVFDTCASPAMSP